MDQVDRKAETRIVKQALAEARIAVRKVVHGRGTAWGWLEITLAATWDRDTNTQKINEATHVAQLATGRRGDYDGRINVHFSAT